MTSFMKEFEHLKLQLDEIRQATNSYDKSRVIGGGGFGAVYKGEVSHSLGRSTVAIKRLNRQYGQGDREFLKEIMMLCRHSHPNLVSLRGYCDEEKEKVLVYEFASKGSLDKHLSDPSLTWLERIKICLGAAKGLCYLHDPKGRHERVIHCDIKSANILLDENMTAKVADFGLSKMGPANQQYSLLVTNAQGTLGYCDPVFMSTYTLTKESDVYSFGVVLFEVLCGKLCYEYSNGQLKKVLVDTWRKKYSEEKLYDIVFLDLKLQMNPKSLRFFSDVAFKCLHNSREDRPTMSIVVEELEKALQSQLIYDLEGPQCYNEIPLSKFTSTVIVVEELDKALESQVTYDLKGPPSLDDIEIPSSNFTSIHDYYAYKENLKRERISSQ
uniref:receptor-like protein kinase HERK 1 n=1 Tax=Erigeron canadensis TaxID=72917 RepID=UPI001CB904AE|nr:receptor-like protein kinase HERK 1 [Erigeron canadensis]